MQELTAYFVDLIQDDFGLRLAGAGDGLRAIQHRREMMGYLWHR